MDAEEPTSEKQLTNNYLVDASAWKRLLVLTFVVATFSIIVSWAFYSFPTAVVICVGNCYCMTGYLFKIGWAYPVNWIRLPMAVFPVIFAPLGFSMIDPNGFLQWFSAQLGFLALTCLLHFLVRRPTWITVRGAESKPISILNLALVTLFAAALIVYIQRVGLDVHFYLVVGALFAGPAVGFTLGLWPASFPAKQQLNLVIICSFGSVFCVSMTPIIDSAILEEIKVLAVIAAGFTVCGLTALMHLITAGSTVEAVDGDEHENRIAESQSFK